MKQKYIAPKIEVVAFDSEDIVCVSAVPVEDVLLTAGISVANLEFTGLMN